MASQAFFQSNSDATRRLNLDVDAIGANTTRTLSVPNRDMTLGVAADVFLAPVNNLVAENVQAAVAELRALFGSYTPSASLAPIATSGSASDLSAGIVPNSRLSAQVGRTDLSNTWAETQTFNGILLPTAGMSLSGDAYVRTAIYVRGSDSVDRVFIRGTEGTVAVQDSLILGGESGPKIDNSGGTIRFINNAKSGWWPIQAGAATFNGDASFHGITNIGSTDIYRVGRFRTATGGDIDFGLLGGSTIGMQSLDSGGNFQTLRLQPNGGALSVGGAATFNGAIGFKEGVWNISNADSARRLFFQNNSTTYIAGNGSNPVQLRNASEQPLVSFNSNFETIFHSTGGGSSGSIYAGSATFTGPTQINGAAGGASTYLQLLNNGSAIGILGSDTSISGGNAADVGLFVYGDNEFCLWTNSTRMMRISDSGSTFNGASTFNGEVYFPATQAYIGYGGHSNYFGGATYFRPVAGGDYTAYVDGVNGDALFEGTITAQGGRPVKTYFGFTTYYGDAGGYVIGTRFRGPSDTDLGMIGVLGTGDNLYSYIIGKYGDEIVTFDNVTKAATFNGAVTVAGIVNFGSTDCRMFRDSGSLYIESDATIFMRDTSTGVANWSLSNDGRTFSKVDVWHSDTEGNPRIAYYGSGGATNFRGVYDFVSDNRGHGFKSDGTIVWGGSQGTNNRGTLSWEALDKAVITVPEKLDIIAGGAARYLATSHEFNVGATFGGAVSATGFGVGVTADASLPFRSLASSNATVGMLLNNTSSGSSASSVVIVESDAGQAGFRQYSLAHSVWPGTTVISSPSGGNGLVLITSGASNPIEFHTNDTLRASIGDSGATFNGPLSSQGVTVTKASEGAIALAAGGTGNTGYLAFFKPNSTRQGFIGFDSGNDISFTNEQSGIFAFNKGATFNGTISNTAIGAYSYIAEYGSFVGSKDSSGSNELLVGRSVDDTAYLIGRHISLCYGDNASNVGLRITNTGATTFNGNIVQDVGAGSNTTYQQGTASSNAAWITIGGGGSIARWSDGHTYINGVGNPAGTQLVLFSSNVVAIGTNTTPTTTFHVEGTSKFTGDATFNGQISAASLTVQSGVRPVKTYFGLTTYYGDAGGYLIGSRFRGPSDTDLGFIGAIGTGDNLYSYIIGEYGDEIVTLYNTTKAATFNGNLGVLGASSFNGRIDADYVGANIKIKATGSNDGCLAADGSGNLFLGDFNSLTRGWRINADGTMATLGSGATTFNGSVVFEASPQFKVDTWINSSEPNNRLFFGSGAATYIVGYGSTPIIARNGAGTNIFGAHSTGDFSIGTASAGNAYTRLLVYKSLNERNALTVRNDDTGSSATSELVLNAYGNSWGVRMGSAANNSHALEIREDALGANTLRFKMDIGGNATFNGAVDVAAIYSPSFRHKNTANEYPWMLYSPGTDVSWYIRDIVNSRMQMTFTPGASAAAAVTQIHSVLNVEGAITSTFSSSTADLSTLDLSAGQSRLHKNTTSGDLKLFANDGGTIKTITLT